MLWIKGHHLRNQDKQLLERTKTQIKGSIWADTGIDSPHPALPTSSSPVPDLVSRQVSVQGTPFTDSREAWTRELLLLSEDASFSNTINPIAPSLCAPCHLEFCCLSLWKGHPFRPKRLTAGYPSYLAICCWSEFDCALQATRTRIT